MAASSTSTRRTPKARDRKSCCSRPLATSSSTTGRPTVAISCTRKTIRRRRPTLWMLPLDGDPNAVAAPRHPVQRKRSDVFSRRSLDRLRLGRKWHAAGVRAEVSDVGPEVAGVKRQIGTHPRWSSDGKELFFDAGGPMMAVGTPDAGPGSEFRWGAPQRLFSGLMGLPPHNFDVADGGQRFLVVRRRNWTPRAKPHRSPSC